MVKHVLTNWGTIMRTSIIAVAVAALAAVQAQAATKLAETNANGHTYQLWYDAAGVNWTTAEARAVALGGHLASVADAAENTLLYDLVTPHLATVYYTDPGNTLGPYLGAFRAVNGGAFAWSDGTAFGYTNWASGEPSNYGGAENWIHFFANGTDPLDQPGEGGFWNDVGPNPNGINNQVGYFVELPGGVPEPAQWALIVGGFGILGSTMRRRRVGVCASVTA
jgi:hypothetical protein